MTDHVVARWEINVFGKRLVLCRRRRLQVKVVGVSVIKRTHG